MQLFLTDGGKQHADRNRHNARHDGEQRQVVHVLQAGHPAGGIQHTGDDQVQDTAHGAHQVDDGIGAAAQGLGGQVGHQGDRRGTVGAHGDEKKSQNGNKQHQLGDRGVGGVAVIQNGQQHHQQDGAACPAKDEGHPAAQTAAVSVTDGAEQRQQEQGQYVIGGHDDTRVGLIQMKGVGQDFGDHAVIHLPEGADGQKRKSNQNGALIVELHG